MKKETITILCSAFLMLPVSQALSQDPAPVAPEFESVEERRIQADILRERENLRKEREDLELRKKELKVLEDGVDKKLAEMDSKLEELQTLQGQITTLLAEKSAEEAKKVKDLAKIYEKMSADKAALALSGLDQQLAADLLAAMKTKAAAKVLDQLNKQKATELSTTFSTMQLE